MIAPRLARAQLARPTVRTLAVVAALVGFWSAWSPGTAFGLAGLLGGWQFAGAHLLDAGLVPVALAGALTGAGLRERRLDEYLHTIGLGSPAVLRATVGAGGLAALVVAMAFAAGTGLGGLTRVVSRGGSWWIDPAHAPTVTHVGLTLARMGAAAALIGALAVLIGWALEREDLAAAVVVLLGLPYLEQVSALLARLPQAIAALSFSPWGAIRAVALADRGLAAPGYDRPTSVVPFALVSIGWAVVLVVVARPPSRQRGGPVHPGSDEVTHRPVVAGSLRRPPTPPPRRGRGPAIASVLVAAAITVVVGATVPNRLAEDLPWRWQRSWRVAVHQGWSSGQTVDRLVAGFRAADPGGELGAPEPGATADRSRLTRPDAVEPAVADAIRRASRVDRQPEASMRGPDQVTIRLRFDEPIRSGAAAFTDYLVRFDLVADESGHWRVDRTEGPVASATAEAGRPGGTP